jgi:hypothetical protein
MAINQEIVVHKIPYFGITNKTLYTFALPAAMSGIPRENIDITPMYRVKTAVFNYSVGDVLDLRGLNFNGSTSSASYDQQYVFRGNNLLVFFGTQNIIPQTKFNSTASGTEDVPLANLECCIVLKAYKFI